MQTDHLQQCQTLYSRSPLPQRFSACIKRRITLCLISREGAEKIVPFKKVLCQGFGELFGAPNIFFMKTCTILKTGQQAEGSSHRPRPIKIWTCVCHIRLTFLPGPLLHAASMWLLTSQHSCLFKATVNPFDWDLRLGSFNLC